MGNMSRFINNEEAVWHFAKRSKHTRIDPGCTWHHEKIWMGQMLGTYFQDVGGTFQITGRYKVVSISFGNMGASVKIINTKTYQSQDVTHNPMRLLGSSIAVAVPPRTAFERTIKMDDEGNVTYGVGSCLLVFDEGSVERLVFWPKIKSLYPTVAEFDAALNRFERKITL